MAKYLVLIYGNERAWRDLPPEWHAANAARHQALIASAGASVLGVNELEPTSHAVSIRADPSGNPSVTRGPFLETPEIVGGYYLIEAADIDAATRLASLIPEATAPHGGVEIRPIAAPG
jgi:hypothetical protein